MLVRKNADKVADKAETECHLPGIDILNMKQTDILALFIKHDATEFLLDARAVTKKMHKLTATLIFSDGTEIDKQNSFTTAPDDDYYCNYDYDYLFGDDDNNSDNNNNYDDANHNNNNHVHVNDELADDNNSNNENDNIVEIDLGREHLNDMI
jgi:hypothetical protein